ncbi:YdeI/OmpD-associated family protein [Demequina aurantiaca]|uniref:YdeI/OmpD-associated family protein n=1 Tax=Demequina aurantiaca TaxID=676200 RepID=UPI003D33C653
MANEIPDAHVVADAAAWRAWLDDNEATSDGVWLVLAKKGTERPTSLRYDQALEEALCSGWIDGQRRSRDATTFLQRFTPRRKASLWSQRNVGLVADLAEQGRMRELGRSEIDRAKGDGRWERAYAGPATIQPPAELLAALESSPVAESAFDALSKSERFAVIHPLVTAPNEATRDRRIAKALLRLSEGHARSSE